MPAPLTNEQKRILSQLANRAFAREAALARGRGETPDTSAKAADDFRRQQVARACGKLGLRCCSQDDYGAVKGHFLDLLGEADKAFQAVHHGEGNARRVAEFKLVQALEAAGLDIGYVAKICWHMFKCPLDDASAEQIWKLTFTVKNRGRKVTFREEAMA
jgi:hypothetical protein